MPGICRMSDLGAGDCSHSSHSGTIPMTGIIINGAVTTTSEGLAQAMVTHLVLGSCGHIGMLMSSSTTNSVENIGGTARVSDIFVGIFTGVLVSGTTTTSSS